MTENIEETTYEEMAKFAMLIMDGTTLKEARKLRYVVTSKDVEAWREVKKWLCSSRLGLGVLIWGHVLRQIQSGTRGWHSKCIL